MDVISLDKGKVKFFDNVVIKKSSYNEFYNLRKARNHICNLNYVRINDINYKIKTPHIFDFDGQYIFMERCFGNNLELLLRSKENHCIGVLQKAEISIFIFCDRKDKNTAMMKVKDLGIKSVHHAYLTDKQIERVEEYYSNIN